MEVKLLNRNIFRQYDIRGKVGLELDDVAVEAIAKAFATFVREQSRTKLIIGRDNRSSSLHIRDLVVKELLRCGMDVVDIGVVITPMFYYASHKLGIDAGMMITASHNPKEYNGFKLLLGDSTIHSEDILRIYYLATSKNKTKGGNVGELQYYNIYSDYLKTITDRIVLGERRLKVVIDCGNGTAGFIAPRLFKELGCEVIELYCNSDPRFPNHHPDPAKAENCQDLIRVVKTEGADLGLGFDGDGDRLGVVDSEGNIIWGDLLMILFWREILTKFPGADCLVEIKCSQALIDEIKRLGGKPIFCKTGHSLIKAKMKDIGAVFAGEMSGHMFFADEYFGYDDALYAAARLLRILSHTEKSLSELLADIPRYYNTTELRIPSDDTTKFIVVDKVRSHFKKLYEVIDIDGARILFPGGWGLVRASNTGPELIIRCEGQTTTDLVRIKSELYGYLDSIT